MMMNQSAFPCHSFPSKITVSALSFTFLAILFFKCFYAPIWQIRERNMFLSASDIVLTRRPDWTLFPLTFLSITCTFCQWPIDHIMERTFLQWTWYVFFIADRCSFQHVQPLFDSRKSNTMTNRTSSTSFFLGRAEAQYEIWDWWWCCCQCLCEEQFAFFMGTFGDFSFI